VVGRAHRDTPGNVVLGSQNTTTYRGGNNEYIKSVIEGQFKDKNNRSTTALRLLLLRGGTEWGDMMRLMQLLPKSVCII